MKTVTVHLTSYGRFTKDDIDSIRFDTILFDFLQLISIVNVKQYFGKWL